MPHSRCDGGGVDMGRELAVGLLMVLLLLFAGFVTLGVKGCRYHRANPWDVGFSCKYCGTPAPGKGRNWPKYTRRDTGKERMSRHGRSLTPVPIYEYDKTDSFAFDSPDDHAEDCPHYKSLAQIKAEKDQPHASRGD